MGPRNTMDRWKALGSLSLVFKGQNPRLNEQQWDALADLAIHQRFGPALWGALERSSFTVSDSVRERLRSDYLYTLARNMRAKAQLDEVITALNDIDIVPVPLKGSLLILDGDLKDVGQRKMVDLDLLVSHDMDRATSCLESLGYQATTKTYRVTTHDHEMVRAGSPAAVELHTELGEQRVIAVLPTAEVVAESSPRDVTNRKWLSMSATHNVLYHVLHTQIADRSWEAFTVSLRQLQTFQMLVANHETEIDWPQINQRMIDHDYEAPYLGYLLLASRFFGVPWPSEQPCPSGTQAARLRWHSGLAQLDLAFGGKTSTTYRNLRAAFEIAYLRQRYGETRTPAALLRLRHGLGLLRHKRTGASTEVLDNWW
jgi:hypothetical protein